MKTKFIKSNILIIILMICFTTTGQTKIGNQKRNVPNLKTAKIHKSSLCEKTAIHRNFRDIVSWLRKNGTDQYEYGYRVEVTRIYNGIGTGNKKQGFGTAWAEGSFTLDTDKCTISTGELSFMFSNKNYFKGEQIPSKYELDYINNAYILVRNNSVRYPAENNLIRKGNMIYTFDYEGKMVVFNFYATKQPRIQ